MSWRPQLNVVCGRCGKPRGLAHVCVSNSRRRQAVKPQLSFGKCEKCKKPVGNPLTHVCAPRSDFKARKAKHDKEQRAKARKKRQQQAHDYTACADNECKRALCVAYKTGWKSGDEAGYERGWQQGYRAGYANGFPDGIAACPRTHK
jgi:flagellar biosynthesis/type III secretory pathway protein FliH